MGWVRLLVWVRFEDLAAKCRLSAHDGDIQNGRQRKNKGLVKLVRGQGQWWYLGDIHKFYGWKGR